MLGRVEKFHLCWDRSQGGVNLLRKRLSSFNRETKNRGSGQSGQSSGLCSSCLPGTQATFILIVLSPRVLSMSL